jgi:hypothetical protein
LYHGFNNKFLTENMSSFFTSWYRPSSLFQLHILIPYFPRSASISASIWLMFQNMFGHPSICHFI